MVAFKSLIAAGMIRLLPVWLAAARLIRLLPIWFGCCQDDQVIADLVQLLLDWLG